jgi:hypothetical protein
MTFQRVKLMAEASLDPSQIPVPPAPRLAADVVHVDAFAFVGVIVVVADVVPAVDDRIGHALEPDIQAAGLEHFLVRAGRRRGGQGGP